jgi:hypothetical protein
MSFLHFSVAELRGALRLALSARPPPAAAAHLDQVLTTRAEALAEGVRGTRPGEGGAVPTEGLCAASGEILEAVGSLVDLERRCWCVYLFFFLGGYCGPLAWTTVLVFDVSWWTTALVCDVFWIVALLPIVLDGWRSAALVCLDGGDVAHCSGRRRR